MAETREKAPPPSLTNHRLWSVAVQLAPPHADAKTQGLLDAVKVLLNQTAGVPMDARWMCAQLSVHTSMSAPAPLAGGAPSAPSASGCSSVSSALVIRPGMSSRAPPFVNAVVYLLCGKAGKRKAAVKKSIELLMKKMAAAQSDGAILTRAAGACS